MASLQYSLRYAFLACFRVIPVFSLFSLFLVQLDAASVNREVDSLVQFKNANTQPADSPITHMHTGYFLTWNENDLTPCAWFGVTCTADNTVEELDFSGWGLGVYTAIDLEGLDSLRDLRGLDMSSNNFSIIYGDLGKLSGLTRLDLSRNVGERFSSEGQFIGDNFVETGVLSNISACKNMRVLALQQSLITFVASGVRDLVNLQSLNLANNLLSGPFPAKEVGNLSTLTRLDLSGNGFNGSIPSLPNLSNLFELKLDNNNLTGFEEPGFLGTTILQVLTVSNNLLEGMIPSSIASFANLQLLNMSNNNLSGKIPAGFSASIVDGMTIDLSFNQLSGEIPTDFLRQNDSYLINRTQWPIVDMSHNLLTGDILIDGSKPFRFAVLDLSHNNLSGPFPSVAEDNTDSWILKLRLQHNRLYGNVVDALLGPTFDQTSEFNVEDNLFTGDLSRIVDRGGDRPDSINGVVINLRNNRLEWSVSEALPDPIQSTLEVVTSNWQATEFRVGGNNFSGTSLPTACGVNTSTSNILTVLELSNSHLKGEILSEAFNYTCVGSLRLLNLSNNDVTGPMPNIFFAQFDRQFVVDVSNNNLSGNLPVILPGSKLYDPKYFAGNDELCGDPLRPCFQPRRVKVWPGVLLIIIGISVTIAIGSCLAATWRWRVYQKRHQQDADLIKTLLERDFASLMPLRDLKKATDNFADSAQIGEGGFGSVYVGKLNDGTVVAIKRSKRQGSEKDKEQFLNEVRILSQVSHRHLVKLLGCCMENKIAVLVFEFVANGTLQDHLRGEIEGSHLRWKQRLNIAIQTADALYYLHSAAAFPIIHRDVKSTNILLSENLDAKVADFGISRLAPLRATHVSTAAIQGTMGYIDPEYYTSFQLTDKSDVYSFGVVLLELISAKPCIDFCRGGDETSLVNFARPYIEKGDLEQFIDPVLTETYRDQTHLGRESILNVGRLAMKCVGMQSKSRPSMKQVLEDLQNVSLKFSGTAENVDSIDEEGNEDLQCDNVLRLLSNSFSTYSSTFSIKTDDDIEMSLSSSFGRFRSRSMG